MKTLSTLLSLLLLSTIVHSQSISDPGSDGEIWFHFQMGFPSGEFKETIDRASYGGNLGAVVNPSKKSNFFQIGGEIGFLFLDKNKEVVNDIKIKTTNTILTYHAVIRIRPQTDSKIKPYADILIGGKTYFTTLSNNNSFLATLFNVEDESIHYDQSHTAFSYGPGFGLTIDNLKFVKFDLRATYLLGGKVEYIRPENAVYNGQTLEIEFTSETVKKTNMIMIGVGMIFPIS